MKYFSASFSKEQVPSRFPPNLGPWFDRGVMNPNPAEAIDAPTFSVNSK